LKTDPGGVSTRITSSSTLTRGVTLPRPGCCPCFWGFGGVVPFSVPTARLDVRAAFQTFLPGDLFALFGDRLRQGGDFTEQFAQQRFKLCTVQRGYLSAVVPGTEVPAHGLLAGHGRRRPYIFSDDEIEALTTAAATAPPREGLRPSMLTTLLGQLASTGLRFSEAIRLC
jgi:integrase